LTSKSGHEILKGKEKEKNRLKYLFF